MTKRAYCLLRYKYIRENTILSMTKQLGTICFLEYSKKNSKIEKTFLQYPKLEESS